MENQLEEAKEKGLRRIKNRSKTVNVNH